jgi:hypothetical protein
MMNERVHPTMATSALTNAASITSIAGMHGKMHMSNLRRWLGVPKDAGTGVGDGDDSTWFDREPTRVDQGEGS